MNGPALSGTAAARWYFIAVGTDERDLLDVALDGTLMKKNDLHGVVLARPSTGS